MERDLRDPQAMGEFFERNRPLYPDLTFSQYLDLVAANGTPFKNYGETEAAFQFRAYATLNGNGSKQH